MSFVHKKIRYSYWLFVRFAKKNFRYLLVSFIIGFFLVVFFINFFPFISASFNRKNATIGIVGHYTFSNIPSYITDELSNPLLTINAKGEIFPLLITSYEVLENNTVYRFHLKPNLVWNDGKKFTAYDIHYNFKGVDEKIIDERTIEFKLNQPLSSFPTYLTKSIFKNPLVGIAGIYELNDYVIKNGELTSLKLSPNKKNLPSKTYKFYDTETKLINAYKKGEIAMLKTSKKNIADLFSRWKNSVVTKTVNYNQILTLFFNTKIAFLKEKEVREALAYAAPVLDEWGVSAEGPISPLSWAYAPHLKKYSPDTDKAAALLKKVAGDEKTPELTLYTFYDYLTVAESMKKNYEKLGVGINLKALSYLPQDFDMLLTIWNPPQDPDQYYFWHSTQQAGNITHYKNVKVDKLLEDGRKTLDVKERKKIYADFQKNIVDDIPAFFIYYPYVYTIEKK